MTEKQVKAYEGDKPYFFVSYAHKDDELVHVEMTWIRDEGYQLWYDDGIHVGTVWRRALADALDKSSGLIFFCTANSSQSDNCLKEINFALDRGKPIFVVQLDDTPLPSELLLSLSDRQLLARSQFDEATYHSKLTTALATVVIPQAQLEASPRALLEALEVIYAERKMPQPFDTNPTGRSDQDLLVTAVNMMLVISLRIGSSELHFDVIDRHGSGMRTALEGYFSVRIDGVIHHVTSYDFLLHAAIIARLKLMSLMDRENSDKADFGRIKFKIKKDEAIDFLVSTLPTLAGESCTLRVFSTQSSDMGLNALGLSSQQEKEIHTVLTEKQGLIIASGPPEGGKKVTANTMLMLVEREHRHIITIQKTSSWYRQKDVIQYLTGDQSAQDTRTMIQNTLKQNPDTLYVDLVEPQTFSEIANVALSRQVITTMYSRDAVNALLSLQAWGDSNLSVSEAFSLITSQRLLRRLCPHCKKPQDEDDADQVLCEKIYAVNKAAKPDISFFSATGCHRCHDGYRGRIGIFEILTNSAQLEQALINKAGLLEIRQVAIAEGMETMALDAVRKVAAGITSMQEVRRMLADLIKSY